MPLVPLTTQFSQRSSHEPPMIKSEIQNLFQFGRLRFDDFFIQMIGLKLKVIFHYFYLGTAGLPACVV